MWELTMTAFTLVSFLVTTEDEVASEPVPVVVGTATIGRVLEETLSPVFLPLMV